jgi:hypothetical protein
VTNQEQEGCAKFGCGCLVLILMAVGSFFFAFSNAQTHTGQVGSTWVKHHKDGPDRFYLALDKPDGTTEVFQVKDSAWRLHFNSADLFARLRPGTKIRVHSNGYRVGWLSWFPNANEIEVIRDE